MGMESVHLSLATQGAVVYSFITHSSDSPIVRQVNGPIKDFFLPNIPTDQLSDYPALKTSIVSEPNHDTIKLRRDDLYNMLW